MSESKTREQAVRVGIKNALLEHEVHPSEISGSDLDKRVQQVLDWIDDEVEEAGVDNPWMLAGLAFSAGVVCTVIAGVLF